MVEYVAQHASNLNVPQRAVQSGSVVWESLRTIGFMADAPNIYSYIAEIVSHYSRRPSLGNLDSLVKTRFEEVPAM